MCHELDEFYWSYRAEQARKEMEKAKELKKQPGAPAKPVSPDSETEVREPVPA